MTKEQLGQIILASERQMYAAARSILKNDQDCADAIQESIVKAFMKYQTLKRDEYAKTWLIRIVINECYNIVRKQSRTDQYMEISEIAEKEEQPPRNYNTLYQAVEELKEELRVPVILYYVEDFRVKEIAQVLNISEGAVQKRLARAREKLRRMVDPEEM